MNLVFEKIGTVQLDKDLQCFKIQIDTKKYLIGLLDLEQAIKNNQVISVFQIAETPIQQETVKKDNEK